MLNNKNCCLENSSLKEVMKQFNKNMIGAAALVDAENRVTGLLTDGDIRRALLNGASLEDLACEHMNTNFIYTVEDRAKALSMLSENLQQVLILDKNRKFKDIIIFKYEAMLPISSPSLPGNELKYLRECIETNWISSQGSFVTKFEQAFSHYHGGLHALTTSSGTTALHLALLGCGIGEGDEVIVPDSTFISSASSVIHAGAVPVLVDVDPHTWCIDPKAIEQAITPRTKAIMPVHLYGRPAHMDDILAIAKKHGLYVIEDCAESLGALYKGKRTGEFGIISCFSFFANKVITTGEGGMVVTSDEKIYTKIKQLRDHGTSASRRYWHDVIGYNYRLTNLQSAIGLAQLENIETFLAHRAAIAALYKKNLSQFDCILLPEESTYGTNIFWLYTIILDPQHCTFSRDALMEHLRTMNIDSRPFFPALHAQPALLHLPSAKREFPYATHLAQYGLSLPTGNEIQPAEVQYVCDTIARYVHSHLEEKK